MLLAHNGVSYQQKETSNTEDRSQPQVNKRQNPTDNADVRTHEVEPQPQSNREVEPPIKTTTIQTAISDDSISKFIPGWGESVFILLVISPFLLLGIKRQLHR